MRTAPPLLLLTDTQTTESLGLAEDIPSGEPPQQKEDAVYQPYLLKVPHMEEQDGSICHWDKLSEIIDHYIHCGRAEGLNWSPSLVGFMFCTCLLFGSWFDCCTCWIVIPCNGSNVSILYSKVSPAGVSIVCLLAYSIPWGSFLRKMRRNR